MYTVKKAPKRVTFPEKMYLRKIYPLERTAQAVANIVRAKEKRSVMIIKCDKGYAFYSSRKKK